jgi:hypothetical protein
MPSKPIAYFNESPISDPSAIPEAPHMTVCMRSDTAYLMRATDSAWVKARLRDGKVSIKPEEVEPAKAAIAGDWRIAGAAWGAEFSGTRAILIFDLEPA